ncbi:hypothetical protein Thiowin_04011 [Thiorhodovibrio winogradskyi]|uniref:Secreted protein n=1 Tax=Thiorhodovibrio winogradskyi TaxID=77007 RepID=A0ABZ0SFN9_9GAMM
MKSPLTTIFVFNVCVFKLVLSRLCSLGCWDHTEVNPILTSKEVNPWQPLDKSVESVPWKTRLNIWPVSPYLLKSHIT